MNRSMPPPFWEIQPFKFQELCADLLAEDGRYSNALVYGRNGQPQRGIDIEATIRQGKGLDVGQCKAWSEATVSKINKASEEFLPHLAFWRKKGLKQFILLVGCDMDDTKVQDKLRDEKKRFKKLGIEYEWLDARTLRRKLRPHAHIVRTHCEPADYWVDFICGPHGSQAPLTQVGAATQTGFEALLARLGYIITDLGEAHNKQLDAIRKLWEKGSNEEALFQIARLQKTTSWPDLSAKIRAKALRMQGGLILSTTGDMIEAGCLLQQAIILDPHGPSKALEALIAYHERGGKAALEILNQPANPDEWNIRLCMLLELGLATQVMSELSHLPPSIPRTPEILWSEGIALLVLKRLDEAQPIIQTALAAKPHSLSLRLAAAQLDYASGISSVFAGWKHLSWPIPPPWHLVKRDSANRNRRFAAATSFGELIQVLSGRVRNEVRIWQLACLANEPDQQEQAEQLCRDLLKESPGYVPALVWSQERQFEIDVAASIAALRQRMGVSDVNIEEVIALFALIAETESIAAAELLLDKHRPLFESSNQGFVWRSHKTQVLVQRGAQDLALKLADEETDPDRQRMVRQSALRAIARKEQNAMGIVTDYEQEFKSSGDGGALFSCCLAKRSLNDWKFISDHAEQLVQSVGTEAALLLAAEACLNAHRPELVQRLIEKNQSFCSGDKLPPTLQRCLAEAFRQQGRMGRAVEHAAEAAKGTQDFPTQAHLFKLQSQMGDLRGSVQTAKSFLNNSLATPQFLIQEVLPTIRTSAPELARQLVKQAADALPENSSLVLLTAVEAAKAGMRKLADLIFAQLSMMAQTGVAGIQMMDLEKWKNNLQNESQSRAVAFNDYKLGNLPLHALASRGDIIFSQWLLAARRENQINAFPLRCLSPLTRYAGLVSQSPVILHPKDELFLDITSFYLLQSLGVLEVIEKTFSKIVVPGRLTDSIRAEVDRLQPTQPDRLQAKLAALALVQNNSIRQWIPDSKSPSAANNGLANTMGVIWCQRLKRVRAVGGVLIDFFPLRSKTLAMDLVILREDDQAFVIAPTEIVYALQASGVISTSVAASALESLGAPVAPAPGLESGVQQGLQLRTGIEVHLEFGIAEELAVAGVLTPLTSLAAVFVDDKEIEEWKSVASQSNQAESLRHQLEGLLEHLSHCFNTDHYRAHLCLEPHIQEGRIAPLSVQELCFQDTLDYAVKGSGAVCWDDRYLRGLNRESKSICLDSWDLIGSLHSLGAIGEADYYDMRTELRATNVRYLSLSKEEILYHLHRASVVDGQVLETPPLKILRRHFAAELLDAASLQRPVVSPSGQLLLQEMEFPVRAYLAISNALVEIWKEESGNHQETIARCEWLWTNLWVDLRIMTQLFDTPSDQLPPLVAIGHSIGYLFCMGLQLKGGMPGGSRKTYFQWVYDRCIANLTLNSPAIQEVLARTIRDMIESCGADAAQLRASRGEKSVEYRALQQLLGGFISDLPLPVQESLQLSQVELKQWKLSRPPPIEILGFSLSADELWGAVSRAAIRGEGAVLKKEARLQFRRDQNTGEIRVLHKAKGTDAVAGGLEIPFLALLGADIAARRSCLQSLAHWFDLDEPHRSRVFTKMATAGSPASRIQLLETHRENSAAWHYEWLEGAVRGRQSGQRSFHINDLLPKSLAVLRQHLRLAPSLGGNKSDWNISINCLLESEGLEETIVRLTCLPARLSEVVFNAWAKLALAERGALLGRLSIRLQSPLQRLHRVALLVASRGDDSTRATEAKQEILWLTDPERGGKFGQAFLSMLKWVDIRLGWSPESCRWTADERLRVTWVHAGRLHAAFASAGAKAETLTEWLDSNSQELTADAVAPHSDYSQDAAFPSGLTYAELILAGLADIVELLPDKALVDLDLPTAIHHLSVDATRPPQAMLKLCLLDVTLKRNAIDSFLGKRSRKGLGALLPQSEFKKWLEVIPQDVIPLAMGMLAHDPQQAAPWYLLYEAIDNTPFPAGLTADFATVVRSVDFLAAFERDLMECSQLVKLSSRLASTTSDASIRSYLLEQLLEIATKAEKLRRGRIGSIEKDGECRALASAILDACWQFSAVAGQPQITLKEFTKEVSALFARWPELAIVEPLLEVAAKLPIKCQVDYWRLSLTQRAWK